MKSNQINPSAAISSIFLYWFIWFLLKKMEANWMKWEIEKKKKKKSGNRNPLLIEFLQLINSVEWWWNIAGFQPFDSNGCYARNQLQVSRRRKPISDIFLFDQFITVLPVSLDYNNESSDVIQLAERKAAAPRSRNISHFQKFKSNTCYSLNQLEIGTWVNHLSLYAFMLVKAN